MSGSRSPIQPIVVAVQLAMLEAHRRVGQKWGACVEGVSKWMKPAASLRDEVTTYLL